MDENNIYNISAENVSCGKMDMEKVTITSRVIIPPPKLRSILWIGDKHYKTSLPVDQHFNWFQKLMWKWCFGVKVEDYSEE